MNPSSFNGITIRSIKWTDSDGAIISNTNTLILPNVVPSINNTEYTCTAEVDTNPGSCLPEKKAITIDTKSIAFIKLISFLFSLYLVTYVYSTFIPIRFSFLINSTVNIECIIILNTPVGPGIQPNVTWYHNMTDITHYSSLRRNHDNLFTSILTIDSIKVSDAGVYHCNAGIDSNVTTNNISVCVTGNASHNSVFAINIYYSVNETLLLVTEELSLGQDYSIDCITGPVPTEVSVSWLITNGSIYSNNNTLMIPSILPSHNNTQYTCTIMDETNPSGCSTKSLVITFRVKGKSQGNIMLLSYTIYILLCYRYLY